MPGPMKTRTTTVEENQRNNLRALSNPVARLKRQDAKAKSRWAIAAERQWDNMLRDAVENPLPEELSPLALFFIRSVKSNFGFAAWVIFFLIQSRGWRSSEANPFVIG